MHARLVDVLTCCCKSVPNAVYTNDTVNAAGLITSVLLYDKDSKVLVQVLFMLQLQHSRLWSMIKLKEKGSMVVSYKSLDYHAVNVIYPT